jgi:hypothetical protein
LDRDDRVGSCDRPTLHLLFSSQRGIRMHLP